MHCAVKEMTLSSANLELQSFLVILVGFHSAPWGDQTSPSDKSSTAYGEDTPPWCIFTLHAHPKGVSLQCHRAMGMSLRQSSHSHRCPRWAYIQWKEHANQASSELPEHWGYYGNIVLLYYGTFLKKGSEWKLCNLKDIVVPVGMWVLYGSSTRKYFPRFRREHIQSWSFHWSSLWTATRSPFPSGPSLCGSRTWRPMTGSAWVGSSSLA